MIPVITPSAFRGQRPRPARPDHSDMELAMTRAAGPRGSSFSSFHSVSVIWRSCTAAPTHNAGGGRPVATGQPFSRGAGVTTPLSAGRAHLHVVTAPGAPRPLWWPGGHVPSVTFLPTTAMTAPPTQGPRDHAHSSELADTCHARAPPKVTYPRHSRSSECQVDHALDQLLAPAQRAALLRLQLPRQRPEPPSASAFPAVAARPSLAGRRARFSPPRDRTAETNPGLSRASSLN